MKHQRLKAAVLVAPMILFLALFFIWPLWTMMVTSVQGGAVREVFPNTALVLGTWDGQGELPAAAQDAVVQDLREEIPADKLGDTVRSLNSQYAGFRTLLPRTARVVREAGSAAPVKLEDIDPRWNDRGLWLALKRAMPRYTDSNLLSAVDLKRDESRAIVQVSPDLAVNRPTMLRTFVVSAQVTALCILIGLPFAMVAASFSGWKRQLLLAAVLLPLWTSLLVRTASWMIILQDNGLINQLLQLFGIADRPIPLIYNRTGVLIAMTHVLLPFMVLPIFSSLVAIPRNLMPAASALGARPWQAFAHVLLPLALPGLLSGSLLVFMVALGYYITPALTGGSGDQMISSVIAFYAINTANWGMAGALGLFLLIPTTALYFVYGRLSKTSL